MHPYARFLDAVERPSRYLGGEYLEVVKASPALARIALCFPDLYDIGMSHLGTKILYTLLNRDPRVACERCYAPWGDLERELRGRGVPLVSLETAVPLRDFDVVGFSLQYELTYTNVLLMLDLGGVPLRAAARGPGDPFVIAGGPNATHPEPLAPFVDAFFIGEAEGLLADLVHDLARLRRERAPRPGALATLAGRYPLYVPALYRLTTSAEGLVVTDGPVDDRGPARVRRVAIDDLARFPFPDDAPVPHAEAVFDRAGVEIASGCTVGCRFCQAGMIYRPTRERHPDDVLRAVLHGVQRTGYDETSLTSLSTADYSAIVPLTAELMRRLKAERVTLGLSSLRAYGLPESLLRDLAGVRATGLTFAPEAGTQRLRDVIAKNVTEADIEETTRRVFGLGFRRMKLYFMLGLPTETDEDVTAIAKLAGRLQRLAQRLARGAQVTVSVSTHVPKPHTPFQWCAMDSLAEITRKQRLLRSFARAERLTLKWHEASMSIIEAALGRGDRRVADAIEHAYRHGARFDGWDDLFSLPRWEAAFAAAGVGPETYLAGLPVGARLPWDHVDVGLDPEFLAREHRHALRGQGAPPCGKAVGQVAHHASLAEDRADERKLVCYDCGAACDLAAMRERRAGFLRALGAEAPRLDAAIAHAGAAAPAPGPQRPAPGPGFQAAPGRRLRLLVTKLGPAAYLGHLDYLRLLPRIARRAAVPLFYSAGFHPKPEVAAGPALGLGIPSRGEVFDVRFEAGTAGETLGEDALCHALEAVAPAGVRFLRARELRAGDPPLGRVLGAADYAVEVAGLGASADDAAARLAALVGSDATVVRVHKAAERRLAVGPHLLAAWPAPQGLDLAALGLQPPVCVLRLRVTQDGALRPAEVVAAACGAAPATRPRAARLALWALGADGAVIDPFDLERVRGLPRPGRAPAPPAAAPSSVPSVVG
ncbi:MAG: TIGR03960 family B12-binding radical SAM protein [Deltaproteobacteria bacterium]|nr:TIGR03960 family B12-binding radical SAM protein [Deltaproteobacteria bacterium]